MLCKPRAWARLESDQSSATVCKENESISFYLDGGYLKSNKFLTLLRYHFLSSKSLINFRITRVSDEVLANVSKLQTVGFKTRFIGPILILIKNCL
jgi:hypothetical protein